VRDTIPIVCVFIFSNGIQGWMHHPAHECRWSLALIDYRKKSRKMLQGVRDLFVLPRVALQSYPANLYCRVTLQNYTAKLHCKATLHCCTAKLYCFVVTWGCTGVTAALHLPCIMPTCQMMLSMLEKTVQSACQHVSMSSCCCSSSPIAAHLASPVASHLHPLLRTFTCCFSSSPVASLVAAHLQETKSQRRYQISECF